MRARRLRAYLIGAAWLLAIAPASTFAHHTPGHGIAWIGPATVAEM